MVTMTIDDVLFRLRQKLDFSWLNQYGKVFSVFDETGSGCICFGVENQGLLQQQKSHTQAKQPVWIMMIFLYTEQEL